MTAVYRGARSGSPEPALTGYWAHSYSQQAYTAPQSTTLGLHPVIHVPNYMDHYSFYRPLRDGWLSWPCWLTDSGRLNRKVVTHPASSLAQDRESSLAETSVLTTMLRRQRFYYCATLRVKCGAIRRPLSVCYYTLAYCVETGKDIITRFSRPGTHQYSLAGVTKF